MIFSSPYWDNKTKLDMLARWIIFHSYMYYELDNSVVTDDMFDSNCKQFVKLAKEDNASFKEHKFYYAMYDFDGSTGFDLFKRLRLEHKSMIANDSDILLNKNKRGTNGRKRNKVLQKK